MPLKEDLDVFTDDFGVDAKVGTTTGKVIFDQPDATIIGGDVISTDYAITFKSSLFLGLKYNDAITVDGDAYTVREVKKIDDGAFSTAALKKV